MNNYPLPEISWSKTVDNPASWLVNIEYHKTTREAVNFLAEENLFCGGRHKASGRNFYCPVAQTGIARDVNGAQNNGRRWQPIAVKPVSVKYAQPVWLKRHLTDYERSLAKRANDKQKYRRVQTA